MAAWSRLESPWRGPRAETRAGLPFERADRRDLTPRGGRDAGGLECPREHGRGPEWRGLVLDDVRRRNRIPRPRAASGPRGSEAICPAGDQPPCTPRAARGTKGLSRRSEGRGRSGRSNAPSTGIVPGRSRLGLRISAGRQKERLAPSPPRPRSLLRSRLPRGGSTQPGPSTNARLPTVAGAGDGKGRLPG